LERCKKESENFENNKFKEVREDLRVETRKYIEEINNFFSSINAESFTDFNGFNSKIKTFNDELNRIMKASANISTLVYVIQNVSEDDFYTYTDFISYFSYDENKFNNASEIDTKNLKRLDKFLERADDDFELYKERGDLRAELGLYNEAIDDYKKALELKPNYDEAKNALEEINKKLTNTKTVNKKSKINNYIKDNNTQ
ncbi:tetratricopeptide repeat protein, partial [Brachyspira pulli]